MRRTATALGSLVMAGSLALGLSGSAWAAEGTLTVSGQTYTDPAQGCYTGNFWPLSVNNETDTLVYVFDNDRCYGQPIDRLGAGDSRVFEFGESVRVPR
ncbi:hypothetical protein [Streptomyces sp. NPDC051569]|uniref:hypothetical protein n=1 Tax=Streptomyces sp. NPDC051569 TaxID=3365661 RepID=UPI0037B175C6